MNESNNNINLADYTTLAKNYLNRPQYSPYLLSALLKVVDSDKIYPFMVADIGAGTGQFSKMLHESGIDVTAIEPNDQMIHFGRQYAGDKINWIKAPAEATGMPDNHFDWVVMASSFHWTDPKKSLPEFHRILKPGGYFTALWNPRNSVDNELNIKINQIISTYTEEVPKKSDIINQKWDKVVSSSGLYTESDLVEQRWDKVITSTGHFKDPLFMQADYSEVMNQERYIGYWDSFNLIRHQIGEAKYAEIIEVIRKEISALQEINLELKIISWTAQRVD